MFTTLTINVACVFLMMMPGFIARKKNWLNDSSSLALSKLMLFFCYPCLIFTSITNNYSLETLKSSIDLPAGSAGIMITGYIVGLIYCWKQKKMSNELKRSFIFQCTINNYSFFPMAIIVSMYSSSMVAALILSTLGAELILWTIGLTTISGHKIGKKTFLALFNPPLLGLYAALGVLAFFHFINIDKSILQSNTSAISYLQNALRTLGNGTVPLAMTIAGARIAQLKLSDIHNKTVYSLSALRLVLIPFIAIGLLHLLPLSNESRIILFIVAVMPVSLNSLLLNEIYGGDRELVAGSVLLTHVLSLITIPLILSLYIK